MYQLTSSARFRNVSTFWNSFILCTTKKCKRKCTVGFKIWAWKAFRIETALFSRLVEFQVLYFIALYNILLILEPYAYSVYILWSRLFLYYSVRHRHFLSGDGYPYSSAYAAFTIHLSCIFHICFFLAKAPAALRNPFHEKSSSFFKRGRVKDLVIKWILS